MSDKDKTRTNGSNKIKIAFEIDDTLWADFVIYFESKHIPNGCCKVPGDLIRKVIKQVLLSDKIIEGLETNWTRSYKSCSNSVVN